MKRELVICHVPFNEPNIKEILAQMKKDGVTSVQIYMHWKKFEPEKRGEFDYSYYDWQVELIKEAGLKFVPFFLMGPRYAAPDWWLEDPKQRGLVCLEHGKESPIDSIWSDDFKAEVDRVIKNFAEHYLPMDVLESFQPGICGDYGEAIMPVHGNWAGAYHTHSGMWCGGEDAKADFRKKMQAKYKTIEALNTAWRYPFKSFDEIETFLQHKAPSRTAWFDLVDWYRGAMTEYVDFWMATSRKYFPDTPIYMCTGGIETPEHASLFSDQAKVAAKYGGGIRLTNERNDFFMNFFDCNAYMHNACDLYGAYLGLEPVGSVTVEGVGSRILGSAFYGNRQLFFYYGNIYPNNDLNGERAQIYRKYNHLIYERKTTSKFAVMWPTYVGIMEGGIPERIRPTAKFIRQRTDYSFVNENMIMDGALESLSLLVIPCAIYTRKDVLDKIREWVESGGILVAVGKVTNLELEDDKEFDKMLGFTDDTDYCEGGARYQIPEDVPYENFAERKFVPAPFGYSNLAEDVTKLAVSKPFESFWLTTCELSCVFQRKHGKGMTISYFAPINFDYNPQDIKGKPVFAEFLDDVLKNFAKDLRIEEGEVVRGEIEGKTYALMPNGEIKEIN